MMAQCIHLKEGQALLNKFGLHLKEPTKLTELDPTTFSTAQNEGVGLF